MNIIEDSRYEDEDLYTKKNLIYMLDVEKFQIMFKGYFSVSEPEDHYIKFKHGDKLVNLYFYNMGDNSIEDLKTEYLDWYLNKLINISMTPNWESVCINDYRADIARMEYKKEVIEIYFIEVNDKLVIFHTWINKDLLQEEKEDVYMIINSFVEKDKANVYKQTFEYYNTPEYVDNTIKSNSFKFKNTVWCIFMLIYFMLTIGVPSFISIYFKQDIILKNKEYLLFNSPIPNYFFEIVLLIIMSACIYGIIMKKVIVKLLARFTFELSKSSKNYVIDKNKGIKGEIIALVICLPLIYLSFNTYTYIDNEYIHGAGFFSIKAIPKYELSSIKRIENKLLYFKSSKELNYYIQIELDNGKKITENNYLTSIYLTPKDEEWVTETSRADEIKLRNKNTIKKIYDLVEKVKIVNQNVILQKEVEDIITSEVIDAAKRELEISKEEEKYLSIYGL